MRNFYLELKNYIMMTTSQPRKSLEDCVYIQWLLVAKLNTFPGLSCAHHAVMTVGITDLL